MLEGNSKARQESRESINLQGFLVGRLQLRSAISVFCYSFLLLPTALFVLLGWVDIKLLLPSLYCATACNSECEGIKPTFPTRPYSYTPVITTTMSSVQEHRLVPLACRLLSCNIESAQHQVDHV